MVNLGTDKTNEEKKDHQITSFCCSHPTGSRFHRQSGRRAVLFQRHRHGLQRRRRIILLFNCKLQTMQIRKVQDERHYPYPWPSSVHGHSFSIPAYIQNCIAQCTCPYNRSPTLCIFENLGWTWIRIRIRIWILVRIRIWILFRIRI